MKSSGIAVVRELGVACVTGIMMLAPVCLHAQGESDAAGMQPPPPPPAPMHLDSAPVPPPSGPYSVPMTMRSQSEEMFPPMEQGAESEWSLPPEEPRFEAAQPRPKSDGHDFTSRPPAAEFQSRSDRKPTFRPLEPDEITDSAPVSQAAPQQAQKMQSPSEAVKNAPASQPQAVTGQRWQGAYPPPRPAYGFGYPPPGQAYPPRGYGYGYPPRPYGYPAQPPAPKAAESQESSTRAPQ